MEVIVSLRHRFASKNDLFEHMNDVFLKKGIVKETYLKALKAREKNYPTGIMFPEGGIAVPHCDAVHVYRSATLILKLEAPLLFKSMDMEGEILVSLVFGLAISDPHKQVGFLRTLFKNFQDKGKVHALLKAQSPKEEIRAASHILGQNISV